jgi:hypothetical protein
MNEESKKAGNAENQNPLLWVAPSLLKYLDWWLTGRIKL